MSEADIGCCGRLTSICKTKTEQGCDNRTCKKIQRTENPMDEPYKQEGELTFEGPDPNKKTVMKVTVLSFSSPTQNRNVVDVKMRDSKGDLVSPQKVAIAQGKREAAARGTQSEPIGQARANSVKRRGPTGCCSSCSKVKGGNGHGGPGCSKNTRGKHSSECGCAVRGSPTRVTQSKHKAGGKQGAAKGPMCRCVRADSGAGGGGSVRCGCKVAGCPAQKDPRRAAIKAAVAARADGMEAAECGCARGQGVPPCACMKDDCPAKKSRDKESIRAAVAARADGFPASECGCPDPPEAPVTMHKSVKTAAAPPPPPPVEPDTPGREKREKDVEDAVLYEKVTAYQTGDAFSLNMAESEGSMIKLSEGEDEDSLPFSNVYTVTYRVRTKPESTAFCPDSGAAATTTPGTCPCSVATPHEAVVSRCSCGNKYLRPQCGAKVAKCSCGNKYLKHDKPTACSCRQRKGAVAGENPCAGVKQDNAAQQGGGAPGAADDTHKGNACEIARLARLRAAKEEKRRRREARHSEGWKKPEVEVDTTAKTVDVVHPETKPVESAPIADNRPRAEVALPPPLATSPTPPPAPPPAAKKSDTSKKDSKKDGKKHKHRDKSKSAHFAQLEVPTTLPDASSECVTRLTNLDSLDNFIGEQKVSAYSMSLIPAVAPRQNSVTDIVMAEAQLKHIAESLRQEVTASLKDQAALVADLTGKFSELTGQVERQTNDMRTMLSDCLTQIAVRCSSRDLRNRNRPSSTGSHLSIQSDESDSDHSLIPRRRGSKLDLRSSASDSRSRSRSRSMSDLSVTESEESLDLRRRDRHAGPRASIIRGSSMSSIGSQCSYSSTGTDASAVSSRVSVASAGEGDSDNSHDSAQEGNGGRRRFGFLRRKKSDCM